VSAFSPILPANLTGQQFSKLNDGNRAPAIAAVPRKPTSAEPSFSRFKTQTG
jgi:hypothetical protein